MKTNKQVKKALLIALAAFSILPGCGKSSSDGSTVTTSGVGSPGYSSFGSGQCASVSYGSSQTITFYGNMSQGSGLQAQLPAVGYGGGSYGGSNYYRNLNTGDSVNVYVSGSTAYAVLSISSNTASAIVQGQSYYGAANGSASICGIYINEEIFANAYTGNGYTGTMGGGVIELYNASNSAITYGPQYGNQPILF